ncbi:MAG: exodeoxyribonuclease V subunit alpha [Pasteurellaceae bacterium]|nr:exodeoxyribonuclease V subunit alpha [Pasteurellaceae bacterium]
MLNVLLQLKQQNVISNADYYFAKLIADKQTPFNYAKPVQDLAVLLAALCNHALQQGNSCLFLSQIDYFGLTYRTEFHTYLAEIKQKLPSDDPNEWIALLQSHIAFTFSPTEKIAPLVWQGQALYFYRSWQDEKEVAVYFLSHLDRAKTAVKNSFEFCGAELKKQIQSILAQLFHQDPQSQWQEIAVATALVKQFCLISGGPGTGKTFTVARILVALQQLALQQHQQPLRIALAAPTGKAAARLTESIERELTHLNLEQPLKAIIPTQAQTLHRLLGRKMFDDRCRFNAKNPLPIDLLIVDEASMIDLALMTKLLQALHPETRVILLGDKDQLASVESGSILNELGQFITQDYRPEFTQYLKDVTGYELPSNSDADLIRDNLVHLQQSRRFGQNSGIGQLARSVNEMAVQKSWQLFTQKQYADIQLIEFIDNQENELAFQKHCLQQVLLQAVAGYTDYLNQIKCVLNDKKLLDDDVVGEIFQRFNQVQVLACIRSGYLGVEHLNQAIADCLREKGLVDFKQSRDWYIGKPIMITQNDSNVGLFNGDIGLYLGDNRVWFVTGKGYKAVPISRIPNYEVAFAMTVHKSQGSEFEHCLFVLPTQFSPVLSKELIYTALTRAKLKLTVFTTQSIWKKAVKTPIQRQSGLKNLLTDKKM